jgi:hypothetical protein
MHTIHEATSSILERIVNVHSDRECSVWPGMASDTPSVEGNAILGTAHGAGVVWTLIQRKTECSGKRFWQITLFWAEREGDGYAWPSLLVWVE